MHPDIEEAGVHPDARTLTHKRAPGREYIDIQDHRQTDGSKWFESVLLPDGGRIGAQLKIAHIDPAALNVLCKDFRTQMGEQLSINNTPGLAPALAQFTGTPLQFTLQCNQNSGFKNGLLVYGVECQAAMNVSGAGMSDISIDEYYISTDFPITTTPPFVNLNSIPTSNVSFALPYGDQFAFRPFIQLSGTDPVPTHARLQTGLEGNETITITLVVRKAPPGAMITVFTPIQGTPIVRPVQRYLDIIEREGGTPTEAVIRARQLMRNTLAHVALRGRNI